MKKSELCESALQKELNRRLDIVHRDGYGDPARADIASWELVVWFGVAILITVVTVVIRAGL